MRIKKKIFYILFFAFAIFSFKNNIYADYKATVVNSKDANCNLYKGTSTGYCYYKNTNLNSYVSNVIWLDTGDEVNVLTDYQTIPTQDSSLCSDYYVYTSYYFPARSNTYYGYYCNANLSSSALTDELKTEFTNAGFPESYFEKLAILKTAHPNWTFKAIDTKLKFSDAVTSESNKASWSLVQGSASNNYAYLATDTSSFDYYNDKFIPYDGNSWYNANYDTVAYYMDPRNFLNDMYIFQFEALSYDDSISDEVLKSTISSAFGDDYLSKFTDDFISAGKQSNVSPVYLASLSKQEVGNGKTAGTAISGTYNGMYNFYNIGATSGTDPVYNGLNFAAKTDEATLRPWNTESKAITGGALWIANQYLVAGQDTSYFKKWNVIYYYLIETGKVSNPYKNYQHQYMTNIMAPSSEAKTTYRSYYSAKTLELAFTFYIPVYSDMPESTSLPTKTGWPNNYLSNITINDNVVADFDGAVETYNYYLDINNPSITISANPVSNTATVEGTGTFEITENTTKTIKVTAQNGDIKNYNINIILTGSLEEPVDIVTTLNNAGIKNNDKYITGIQLGTDISTIKTKIINTNKQATVTLHDCNGSVKENGIIVTGDKITITVNQEERTYEFVIYGDVNGDGKISAVDYVKIKNNIMGTTNLLGVYKEAADVDKNGKVSAVDYVKIKNYIMGISKIEQ